jgi:putative ABC transport system substrate-binding protein
MNITEQGVLQKSKLTYLFVHILLLLTCCLIHPVSAEATPADASPDDKNTKKHRVFIINTPGKILHANIIQQLSDNLNLTRPDIVISKVTAAEEKIKTVDHKTDLIIGIGYAGMDSANQHYPKTKKLFISTDPNRYRLDADTNKNDAILYMTQPYCRQLQFIKSLNTQWKIISILHSRKKPIDSKAIRDCANNFKIKVYIVSTTAEENLTDKIKHALNHSDVLLALPDSSIYNSKTVKNILLTSYRQRKPIIAFSNNFVNAGALASINSSTEQIADSASKLIEQFFDSDMTFERSTNYPDEFDISINRQVFWALDLIIPDINKIKPSLQNNAGALP